MRLTWVHFYVWALGIGLPVPVECVLPFYCIQSCSLWVSLPSHSQSETCDMSVSSGSPHCSQTKCSRCFWWLAPASAPTPHLRQLKHSSTISWLSLGCSEAFQRRSYLKASVRGLFWEMSFLFILSILLFSCLLAVDKISIYPGLRFFYQKKKKTRKM